MRGNPGVKITPGIPPFQPRGEVAAMREFSFSDVLEGGFNWYFDIRKKIKPLSKLNKNKTKQVQVTQLRNTIISIMKQMDLKKNKKNAYIIDLKTRV